MAYTNAVYFCDPINGTDTPPAALLTCVASNPAGSVARINKTAHGLVTGAVVDLTLFTSWLNTAWKITVVDADNFDLDTAVWQATADSNGTVTPRGGMNKATAWKTYAGGTTARVTGGDTVRVIASTDPTLVGDATWTDDSKTVTLAGAVNATIDDCEVAWTASANVTATADTAVAFRKHGSFTARLVFAAGFTTGLAAYRATGTLDLSGYQQVCCWIYVSNTQAAGVMSLRLCTDTVGAVSVHTIAIPQIFAASTLTPVVVDLGGAMNSAIQSVALYCDADPGAVTVYLDNIVACKASSSADSITLHSLIGKAHNLYWAASTVHAANVIRKPTAANRNGYAYKVTAGGGGSSGGTEPTWPRYVGATVADGALTWTCTALEETWYAIQSINGATLKIDSYAGDSVNSVQVYTGTTETVATYKREPLLPTPAGAFSSLSPLGTISSNGSLALGYVTITGGWNRTDMTTQSGETWISGTNGNGAIESNSGAAYHQLMHLNGVRMRQGISWSSSSSTNRALYCHMNHIINEGFTALNTSVAYMEGCRADCNGSIGFRGATSHWTGVALSACGNSTSPYGGLMPAQGHTRLRDVVCKNNKGGFGVSNTGSGNPCGDAQIINLTTANNASGGVDGTYDTAGELLVINPSISEATTVNFNTSIASYMNVTLQGLNGDSGDNRIYMSGGTIRSVTDQRHTASGLAWKFLPTSTFGASMPSPARPLPLSVAKIACEAGVAVSVQIWTRRDHANVKGQLYLAGGQVAGVPLDLSVSCEPTINTWVQSSALSFTPSAAGVVEVLFKVWDGVGSSNAFWIDDLTVT